MSNELFGAVIGTLIFLCLLEHWFWKRRRKRKIAELEAKWKKLVDDELPHRIIGVDLAKPGSDKTVYYTPQPTGAYAIHDDCCSCDDPSH